MKLLPFDLQRALAGDKVVTRDGREVTQLTKFDLDSTSPLYGILDKSLNSWTVHGKYWKDCDSPCDLFMAPKTVKCWLNCWPSGEVIAFKTKSEALQHSNWHQDLIAKAVPVEFEEGYGCE